MATWTAPTTRTTGALISASIWNTDIVENLKYLKDAPTFDGAVKVTGALTPNTNDGSALGSGTVSWADLFLASGGVINFANGDVTVTHSSNTLTFAGAASGYIFNDGNVGIGVTPSAWDSTRRVLQIGGSGSLWTNTSGMGFLFLLNNAYYDGTNYKYLNTDEASYYAQTTAGDHSFATAVSGTAGNNVTFGEKFRVLNGGNVAIGATAKLYLDGVAGTGNTYVTESANDVIDFYTNNQKAVTISYSTGVTMFTNTVVDTDGVKIAAAKKLYLDGGYDTYIMEYDGNRFGFYAGGTLVALINSSSIDSRGTAGIGYYAGSANTNTGTAVVRNADGYLYLTSSSRRFKENISPAVVTDAQLDAFMATAPSWWDYKGQKNGALGFIAEDLAVLPLDRYGFNPLVNYDAEGQIESNRDYALIAMHHLVIQRMQKEIDALKARIH